MKNLNINIVEKLIGINTDYITISPNQHKKGHGSGLSVKIVLPCYCQAHCKFCFNKCTANTQKHDYDRFLRELPTTLDMIVNNITDRPISLDITGNETTFDIENFVKFMRVLKKYHDKVDKIVLTTNGYHLEECLPEMFGIVDIVNISLHHYDFAERKRIFGTSYIPNDEKLKEIVKKLKENNITCTAVAVLCEKIHDFREFYKKFMEWAIELEFYDIRMRSDFCSDNKIIDEILKVSFEQEKIDEVGGLTTKIVIDKDTGFETRILKGVPDLTAYVVGAELVIDDDGLCYVDYNKRYPVNESNIHYFNKFYILK